MIKGNTLTVELPDEQIERFKALLVSSEFEPAELVTAMINLDFEEWQDAIETKATGVSRATRYARFCRAEAN